MIRYTAFSELLPLLAAGGTPLLKVEKISQKIDTSRKSIVNATTLSSPFATFSFSATASFEVRSPSRIQVIPKTQTFFFPKHPFYCKRISRNVIPFLHCFECCLVLNFAFILPSSLLESSYLHQIMCVLHSLQCIVFWLYGSVLHKHRVNFSFLKRSSIKNLKKLFSFSKYV